MAEEQSSSTEQGTSETQTLDQVYKQFNVEEAARSFNPQPQRVEQPVEKQEIPIPDPVLDAAGHKAWLAQQHTQVTQSLSKLEGQLQRAEFERLRRMEETDIKSAVNRFRSITGEEIDEDTAEIALGLKGRKDKLFQAVWANRGQNPQAWNAALTAYANEYKSRHQLKVDPQIAENQRAAKQSIGSQTRQESKVPDGDEALFYDDKGRPLTGSAFDRRWRNYTDSY